jgi:hypothetical protein
MRQASTTLIVVLSLNVLFASAGNLAAGTDVAGTIAHARRLIEAGDHASASALLEDTLIEAHAKEKSAIIELLKKSYEVMAQQAEARGHTQEAAHLRENLEILNRTVDSKRTPVPVQANPKAPAIPKTRSAASGVEPHKPSEASQSGRLEPSEPRPARGLGESARSDPASLPERGGLPKLSHVDQSGKPSVVPSDIAQPELKVSPSTPATTSPAGARADSDGGPASIQAPRADGSDPVASRLKGTTTRPQDEAGAAHGTQSSPSNTNLGEADRFFAAQRYDDAGRCYAALAHENHLPANRREHWAYCRWVEVVRIINAGVHTPGEWDRIEAEIQSVQRLTPNSWYGEYLRSKVAEVRRGARGSLGGSNNVVVRGSAPDESEPRRFPRLFGRQRSGATSQPKVAAAPSAAAAEQTLNLPSEPRQPDVKVARNDEGAGKADSIGAQLSPQAQPLTGAVVGRASDDQQTKTDPAWEVYETPNFRIYHRDPRLAESAGAAAEAARAKQIEKWRSSVPERPWSPRCDLYLYPNGKVFALSTHQPDTSPGFSTMISNGSRVVTRRMSLRADHPQLLAAILPHEVTHVVLADLFTVQQIPRWADEGAAVLAEPRAEQHLRWAELQQPLESGRLFELSKLMAMDYPGTKDWSLYYAQSVSLTHFLVGQGTPERFIQFLKDSHRSGIESALRQNYQIGGFRELKDRWLAHARKQLTTLTASNRDGADRGDAVENR